MGIQFADPGGEYYYNSTNTGGLGITAPGVWTWNFVFSSHTNPIGATTVNTGPVGRATTYAVQMYAGAGQATLGTVLKSSFTTLIVGGAVYFQSSGYLIPANFIISLWDATASTPNTQCSLCINSSGNLYFQNGGGTILGTSTNVIAGGSGWHYIEIMVTIGTTGSAQVWVDNVSWLTLSSTVQAPVNTKFTTNPNANVVVYGNPCEYCYWKDMYVLDTGTGVNITRLGDISVGVQYPIGAGVNDAWTATPAAFTLTSVNTSGVYQGTITGGASNAYVGMNLTVTGFTNGASNITNLPITASTATSITVNATTVVGGSGTGTLVCVVQSGINHTGTWPNTATYIADSNVNDISDFAHAALSLTGTFFGAVHVSYLNKDVSGSRSASQVCISNGTTEVGSTISLTNTFNYYFDLLDADPHTAVAWTLANYNAATFGVKVIS